MHLLAKRGESRGEEWVGHGLDLLGQVVERLDQKAARAAGRVEHGSHGGRVQTLGDGDHEAHDGARGTERGCV